MHFTQVLGAALLATSAAAAPLSVLGVTLHTHTMKGAEVKGPASMEFAKCTYANHPDIRLRSVQVVAVYHAPGQKDKVISSSRYRSINPLYPFTTNRDHDSKDGKWEVNYERDRHVRLSHEGGSAKKKVRFETGEPDEIITDGKRIMDICRAALEDREHDPKKVKELVGSLKMDDSFMYKYTNLPNIH